MQKVILLGLAFVISLVITVSSSQASRLLQSCSFTQGAL